MMNFTALFIAVLPLLNINGLVTVSGLSSGADVAPMFLMAFSDKVLGSGSFAGQAYGCAVTEFSADIPTTCPQQAPSLKPKRIAVRRIRPTFQAA